MQFGSLHNLWVLLVPLVVVLIFRIERMAKARTARQFAEEPLFKQLVRDIDPRRVTIKRVMIVAAFVLVAFSLLQPKWGYHWEEVKRKGIDIVIALDVSKSMLAEDVKPNRLKRAQMEIQNFITQLKGDRIGIVGFAGTAFIHCPLTLDYGTAKMFLDTMDVDMIPVPGTDIGGAIKKAVEAFEGVDKQHRVLILITDGEDHEERVMDIVKDAGKQGVVIYTIGIGSTTGAPIPVTDENGNTTYMKDRQGAVVLSKLDSELLQKIALMTGGKKAALSGTAFPLEEIYQTELSKIEKRELGSTRQKKYENRYQWPLMLALIVIVLEVLVPVRKRRGVV